MNVETKFVTGTMKTLACLLCFGAGAAGAWAQDEFDKLAAYHDGQGPEVFNAVDQAVTLARSAGAVDCAKVAERLASVLTGAASYEAKQFACRQLAYVGTAQQVPVLAKLLVDDRWSDMARYALGRMPGAAVEQALRSALESSNGRTRIGLINTIGFRRDPEAVGALIKVLPETDLISVEAAALALGEIGGPTAARALKAALDKTCGETHNRIADAYCKCAEQFARLQQPKSAVSIYHDLLVATEPGLVRAAALRGLVRQDPAQGAPMLLAGLRDPDLKYRQAALSCVQLLPGADMTRKLAAELPGLPAAEQALLLTALAERGDRIASPVAVDLAQRGEPTVRVAAWEALGKLGDLSVVELLVKTVAAGKTTDETKAALRGLTALRGDDINAALLGRLRSSPAAVAGQLMQVLIDRNAVSELPGLVQLAQEPNSALASQALNAAGQLANEAALPTLLALFPKLSDAAVREAAEQALIEVCRKIANEQNRAQAILTALRSASEPAVRVSLVRVLGGLGTAAALTGVQAALQDSAEPVREAAFRVLSEWPEASVIPVLLTHFRVEANATHRILALRGLVRLSNPDPSGAATNLLALYEQLLPNVKAAEEKKLILSGLGSVKEVRAMGLIEPFLADADVRDEAALAFARIAGCLAASSPDAARSALQKALAASTNPAVTAQAQEVTEIIDQFEGFITTWQACGPFLQENKNELQLFDIPFPPEPGQSGQVNWRTVNLNPAPNQPALVDLSGLFGGDYRVGYLRAWIKSDAFQPARLELGSDDGIKVWLNQKVVHANNINRGLVPGQDKTNVTLNQGWNELLLKVTQGGGGWVACARLRKAAGGKLDGVHIAAVRD